MGFRSCFRSYILSMNVTKRRQGSYPVYMSRKNIIGNRLKKGVEAREQVNIPTYTISKQKPRKIPRPVVGIVLAALLIFGTIYLPPMLLDEPVVGQYASVNLIAQADPAAMQEAQSYLQNNPEKDFDGDGLTNEEEQNYGTGIYTPDNDDDGTSDAAELWVTETNPKVADDAIVRYVITADTKNGNDVNTPFQVNNVVLWAENYQAKARGGVIQLPDNSYNFYRFTGWAQFPDTAQGPVTCAYKVVNGIQVPLERNENGYFFIDDASLVNVRVYTEQPESCIVLYLVGNRYILPDNIGTRILNFVLPHKSVGLITSKAALVNDFDGTWDSLEQAKTNQKTIYHAPALPSARFETNDANDLNTLSLIISALEDGQNAIISLMSHTAGEVLLEVYGYTPQGNLLVCSPETNSDDGNFGVLNVSVVCERMLNKDQALEQYQHFWFQGCGYSSTERHRLMLLDFVQAGTTVDKTGEGE